MCWTERYTTDPERAAAFYQKVFGWTLGPGNNGMPVFYRGERVAGGLVKAPEGVPPHWLNHVAVADLDAAKKKVVERGGRIGVEEAVPGIGRFAVIFDNVGAVVSLFQE